LFFLSLFSFYIPAFTGKYEFDYAAPAYTAKRLLFVKLQLHLKNGIRKKTPWCCMENKFDSLESISISDCSTLDSARDPCLDGRLYLIRFVQFDTNSF